MGMDALTPLLTRFGKRHGSRHWMGPRPSGEFAEVAMKVAAQVGYPTHKKYPFCQSSLVKIDRAKAAELLAFFSRSSLAYDQPYKVREGLRELAAEALADLKKGSLFYTNGGWLSEGGQGWVPMSKATFDGGVIGFDYENAFIYWVEEED